MLRTMSRVFLAAILVSGTAAASLAQTTTTKTTEFKTFEVIAVDGNQLVVKLPEGTREITVPPDFHFTVNGQQMSVSELKPGMKGTATITTRTTSTPVTVTEVKNGTVVEASGGTIMVRTDQGVKSFTQSDVDKRGVKIMLDGKPAQVSDFHSGDRISATIITSKPPQTVTDRQVTAQVARPAAAEPRPAAPPGPQAQGLAPAPAPPQPSPAAPAPAPAPEPKPEPRALPKTASSWPLLGLASLWLLAIGGGLTLRRRFGD